MTDLLPCPFCGGEAQVQHQSRKLYGDTVDWYGVYCKKQFCGYVSGHQTEAEAIAAWNTRSAGTCHNLRDDEYFECSECEVETSTEWCGSGYGSPKFCPNCGRKVTA